MTVDYKIYIQYKTKYREEKRIKGFFTLNITIAIYVNLSARNNSFHPNLL